MNINVSIYGYVPKSKIGFEVVILFDLKLNLVKFSMRLWYPCDPFNSVAPVNPVDIEDPVNTVNP